MEKISAEFKKNEEYTLELTLSEIEFIRRSITGVHEFLHSLNGVKKGQGNYVITNLHGDGGLDDIDLVELEHKIYSQYHDDSGDLVEPNVE